LCKQHLLVHAQVKHLEALGWPFYELFLETSRTIAVLKLGRELLLFFTYLDS
jgi:hypothetical protein